MNFYERVKTGVRLKNTTIEHVAENAGMKLDTYNSLRKRGLLPRTDVALKIAQALGTTVEYLADGKEQEPSCKNYEYGDMSNDLIVMDNRGQYVPIDGEITFVPISAQKVAAGNGQVLLEDAEIVGELPFLTKMLRGTSAKNARALEVRGDSMTGINIFDGDMVVFVPGEIRADGIYVLKVGDELIVKRVEFDQVGRKIHIMSENPRYKDRVESADGQAVEVIGKVYGWVHSHPY